MKRTMVRSCIFTAAVLVLPGCLAINAVLGVMGFLGTGPIQMAGTVYSVTEYSYEYAVNDKTPDEVIEDKLDWLLLPEEDPGITGYAKAFRKSVMSPPMADVDPEVRLADSSLGTSKSITLEPQPAVLEPVMTASMARSIKKNAARPVMAKRQKRVAKKTPRSAVVAKKTAPARKPKHQYIVRETDPLLERLDRLENVFRQAEAIALSAPESGLKLSVEFDGTAPEAHGVSGSWSIRHTIMEHGPSVPTDKMTNADNSPQSGLTVS